MTSASTPFSTGLQGKTWGGHPGTIQGCAYASSKPVVLGHGCLKDPSWTGGSNGGPLPAGRKGGVGGDYVENS